MNYPAPTRWSLAPLLLLGACTGTPDTPGTTTADEDRQLNEAAAALDANTISLNDLNARP